jgi:predicted DNA-binding transcriptional regulator AlpA
MVGRQTDIAPRDWIGVKEAAAALGASDKWVRQNLGSPGWPRYYRVGSQIRWVAREFMEWRERQYHTPPAAKDQACTSSS